MKTPLHYQLTECDCGPTSLLNAISFLFEREEIPPEIVKTIMTYCLDCHGSDGTPGAYGTSHSAMMFLSSWFRRFGKAGRMAITSRYLSGQDVSVDESSEIVKSLHQGGVAVVRLFDECPHYVLFTGEKDGKIYLFDPYYPCDDCPGDITVTLDHPFSYNHIVPFSYFNCDAEKLYSLRETKKREAILIFKTEV